MMYLCSILEPACSNDDDNKLFSSELFGLQ